MSPSIIQIPFHDASITYYRWGSGPGVIIALHGFGESGRTFAPWGDILPVGYTLYAPDLPLHGGSTWPEGKAFTVHQLRELIDIMTGGIAPFTLCGYSMGGRLGLSFYQYFAPLIKRVVLLAPDGLKVNFWYWFSARTWLGNRLFRNTVGHPDWFLGGVRLIGKYNLLNKGIVKYVQRYLGDAGNRKRLYTVWTCMRTFSPDLVQIKNKMRRQGTPFHLIFGHFDQIIRPSQGIRFQKNTGGHCLLHEFHTGHQLLTPALGPACLQIVTG